MGTPEIGEVGRYGPLLVLFFCAVIEIFVYFQKKYIYNSHISIWLAQTGRIYSSGRRLFGSTRGALRRSLNALLYISTAKKVLQYYNGRRIIDRYHFFPRRRRQMRGENETLDARGVRRKLFVGSQCEKRSDHLHIFTRFLLLLYDAVL